MSFYKPIEQPIYKDNKIDCILSFRTEQERDDYIRDNHLPAGYSYNKVYEERKSFVQELHERTGWPLKIKARGYIACLIGEQQLMEGRTCPIYRFPGGDSLVDKCEMIPA